ncbi:type II and III secretion system protein [Marinomonas algarum]|uniref:Type II and III secretion system protein n=1 Tax=Marinomonas algarum TaxID=2883105 RepID=A0A9X1IN14_9GAMM|nr:type II and III secretion system protein [Marinomonas algarum]MCB5162307.1 type II and III secretion system protein [Marinomonas algarum]
MTQYNIKRVCQIILLILMIRPAMAMDVYFDAQPLQDVLPWLASKMNESVVISPDIDETLTLSIKDATWHDVIEAIAKQPSIALTWQGNVAVLMPASAIGTPAVDQEQLSTSCPQAYWVLKHAKADTVGEHLKTLYPSLSLIVDHRTNSIITSSCEDYGDIETTLAWLDTPLRQIEISAQIAQVSRTAQSQFGVNWQASLADGVRSSLGGAIDLGALTPSAGLDFAVGGRSGLLGFTLDMMETDGLAKVMSAPKIVTSEGQPARIESGTEVPYQTVSDDKVSVEFRQAALLLEVTPFVKDGERILLSLNINQDSVGDLVNGVPSLNTNRLKTQVVVKNQETLVLGGIFREERFESESRVPFFSAIPVVGRLFKRRLEQQEKVELLVFITPKLIQMTVN